MRRPFDKPDEGDDGTVGARVGALAHELRNALFGVIATLDALDERFHGSVGHAPYVRVIRDEIDRIAALVARLLRYGEPRALDLAPTSMHEVLEVAVAGCRPRAETGDVEITFAIEPGLPPLRLERSLLVHVFHELTLEAVLVSPQRSTVHLRARRSDEENGSWVLCDVVDDGPRFADVDESDLGEAFFRRRRGGGPTLASARRIVARCGGTLEVGSRTGGGGIVRVRIPL